MNAFAVLLHAIRTTLVLALVGILAFGSLAGVASAATVDHHAVPAATDAGHDHAAAGHVHDAEASVLAGCAAKGDTASHDMGDGSCCVGTCTTILGIALVAHIHAGRIGEIEPFDLPVLARAGTVEFLRPPSPAI